MNLIGDSVTTSRIEQACHVLRTAGVVAYPTETFYGLAVDPLLPGALDKLLQLKGEQRGAKPFPWLVPNMGVAKTLVEVSPRAERIMQAFWPGPLTLVLPLLDPHMPGASGDATLAIRHSSHPVAQALVAKYGRCITTTSANLSQQPAARTMAEVENYFGPQLLTLPGQTMQATLASTVVKIDGAKLQLLRAGAIDFKKVEAIA